jgi:hypothetical protein
MGGFSAVTNAMPGREGSNESERNGDATLLFYLGPELNLSLVSRPNVEIFWRLHHRSGAWGTLGDMHGAANVQTVGLKEAVLKVPWSVAGVLSSANLRLKAAPSPAPVSVARRVTRVNSATRMILVPEAGPRAFPTHARLPCQHQPGQPQLSALKHQSCGLGEFAPAISRQRSS